MQFLCQAFGGPGAELVKNVVVSLVQTLASHTCPFEEIMRDVSAYDLASAVKVDLDKLAEARAVIVSRGLGVAERLKDRVCI